MKNAKNIFFGFIVAFLGSLPPGYLNLVGLQIFQNQVFVQLTFYLIGVIIIEVVVVYATIAFANQLVTNPKIIKFIDFFAVVLFFALAFLFYANDLQTTKTSIHFDEYLMYSPFVAGLVLCAFNLLQIPFWLGWNLYLINTNRVFLNHIGKHYYMLGIVIGTFLGMLFSIVLMSNISWRSLPFSNHFIKYALPLFFVGLAVYQMIKIKKKYYKP